MPNAEFINLGSPSDIGQLRGNGESFCWAGISLKYRFYNVMLQGQFRSSEITYGRDELEPVIAAIYGQLNAKV